MTGSSRTTARPSDESNQLNFAELTSLRSTPQQGRSKARVQAMYDAAVQILAESGIEALTMNAITERASVPIGTVYQFFEDKSAVLDTIAERRNRSFAFVLADMEAMLETHDWRDIFEFVFDRMVQRNRNDPAYVAIWT